MNRLSVIRRVLLAGLVWPAGLAVSHGLQARRVDHPRSSESFRLQASIADQSVHAASRNTERLCGLIGGDGLHGPTVSMRRRLLKA